jgi:hypothetical protein
MLNPNLILQQSNSQNQSKLVVCHMKEEEEEEMDRQQTANIH